MFDFGWQTYLLLGGGLLFVILEVFFPSGGLLGIGAAVCLGFGAWTAYQNAGAGAALRYGATVAVLAPMTILAGFRILPRTPFARAIMLRPDPGKQIATERGLETLIGQSGKAITALRPSGIAMLGERRVDVVTRGMHLDSGDTVRVIKVEGNRVVVEAAPPASA